MSQDPLISAGIRANIHCRREFTVNFITFSQANPEFKGAYVAMAVDNIATMKMFDSRELMMQYVQHLIEIEGYESVSTTLIDQSGAVDDRLMCKETVYYQDFDCDQDPIIEGTDIYVEFYNNSSVPVGAV